MPALTLGVWHVLFMILPPVWCWYNPIPALPTLPVSLFMAQDITKLKSDIWRLSLGLIDVHLPHHCAESSTKICHGWGLDVIPDIVPLGSECLLALISALTCPHSHLLPCKKNFYAELLVSSQLLVSDLALPNCWLNLVLALLVEAYVIAFM